MADVIVALPDEGDVLVEGSMPTRPGGGGGATPGRKGAAKRGAAKRGAAKRGTGAAKKRGKTPKKAPKKTPKKTPRKKR